MWTVRLESALLRVNLPAFAADDKIYSFGGRYTGEDCIDRNLIEVHALGVRFLWWIPLQTESNTGDVPFKMYGHTVVIFGDCVYLWGSRDDNEPYSTLYCFDTYTKMWTRPEVCSEVPWPREGHSASVIDKRMFVFGGLEADRFQQDVLGLDLESLQCQQLRTMGESPLWRRFHSASAIGDRTYVWGGRSGALHTHDEVCCNRLAYLDMVTANWVHPHITGQVPEATRYLFTEESSTSSVATMGP
ncbi:uncharacterized protein LOC144097709 [Amblyomma americanum]